MVDFSRASVSFGFDGCNKDFETSEALGLKDSSDRGVTGCVGVVIVSL